MAWIYEKYAGYPYVSDFVCEKFKFGIEMMEDVISTDIKEQNGVISFDFKTSGKLIPNFYLRVSSENSPLTYNLLLSRSSGLVKELWKIETINPKDVENNLGVKGIDRITSRSLHDEITYSDFEKMGAYAVSRFPLISSEIVSPSDYVNDFSFSLLTTAEKYKDSLSKTNWEEWQRKISGNFWAYFCYYVLNGKNIDGKEIVRFSEVQSKNLCDLVSPLKPF